MKATIRLVLCLFVSIALFPPSTAAANTTYYVSMSDGNDSNGGTSSAAPFKTIAKVNSLVLQPGDRVLFKCGDTWRGEMLRVVESGTLAQPIAFGSYPAADCANKPILSGAQPIAGWTVYSGQIYVADLSAPGNAANFPPATTNGVNQLFRNGQRLGIGRWPNLDAPDGGYSTIDTQPGGNQFTDNQLPAVNWSGATAHIKGMRWYILNRAVTGDSGNTLTVNSALDCWGGNCAGWGFWLSNHLSTLDRDGEWFYDAATRRVYLYSTGGSPANVEGSVVINGESVNLGGVILGRHLEEHVAHVVIENFVIENWFDNGITTPVNLEADENDDIVIRNNVIRNVDSVGINLATWVWNAEENGNGYNGWRGGRNIQIVNNTIVGANHRGIDSYARQSLIEGNVIQDIALIRNLGQSGMGCPTDSGGGFCTEDGDGIRIKVDNDGTYSGNSLTVRHNTLDQVGYNGIDVFGYGNTLDGNVIRRACISKGDCGAIRTFGGDSLGSTTARDLVITRHIIADTIGNTDGARSDFDAQFAFGLYIDHNSSNVTATGNTVISTTAHGILYQDSTGVIQNNTLFANASNPALWAEQVRVTGGSAISSLTGNILLGKLSTAGTLGVDNAGLLGMSDANRFYHANRAAHISAQGSKTLAQWRSYSGKDASSTEVISSTLAQAEIFANDTRYAQTIPLGKPYFDLDGNSVVGNLTLQPFTSKILLPDLTPIPRLSIRANAPLTAQSGDPITYTLTVDNIGLATATGLTISNTLPAGANHVGGGTLAGNVVSWNAGSLAPSSSVQVSYVVTATTTLINTDYRASATGGYAATGSPVVTIVDPLQAYLPLVKK
jgi:uncharacterized repeat protein (TIGR01451 family)